MKKLMLGIIALATLPGSTLLAQNIVGIWQGTLTVNNMPYRAVFKITTTDADKLTAVMYPSIDQSGQSLPAGAITVQGSAVKIPVPGIGGNYEGKVSADGNTMTGNWTLGDQTLPLNFTRATAQTAWAIPEPPARPKPMPADADPSFEVATIKPSKPGQPGKAFRVNGREFSTINTSVSDMMVFAYGIHARQVAGGPDWLEKDKYDVLAKPDVDGQPNDKQLKSMVQKLLADRFKLTFHRDKKELSVYAIVVAKNGSKLTKSEGDGNGLPSLFFRGLGNLPARNATMADFAGVMQSAVLDKPVVDQTGLSGRFDFTLMWTPDEFQFGGLGVKPPAPSDKDTQPDLYTAFQQQLGLRLESTKAQAEVLVIDKVEKPSEN